MRKQRSQKILSLILAILILMSSFTGTAIAAPRDLTDDPDPTKHDEKERVQRAADFLDAMGDSVEAHDIRDWLGSGWIKADDDPNADNGVTDKKGVITVRSTFVKPLTGTETDLEKFKMDAELARLLKHEKTHAHQAPNLPGLKTEDPPWKDPKRERKDWDASGDVFNECIGPEATEVEAYYEFILQLFKWKLKILDGPADPDKQAKLDWLNEQADFWLKRLKEDLNYEKTLPKYKFDEIEEIKKDGTLTDREKIVKKIEKLEENINKLFQPGGAYDKVRTMYQLKRILKLIGEIIDDLGAILSFPPIAGFDYSGYGHGGVTIPAGAILGTRTIEAYHFSPAPPPLQGYQLVSPAYEMLPHGSFEKPVTLTLPYRKGVNPNTIDIYAFAPYKGDKVPMWEKITEGRSVNTHEGTISVKVDHFSIFAVMAPALPTGLNAISLVFIAISTIIAGGYLFFRQKQKMTRIVWH